MGGSTVGAVISVRCTVMARVLQLGVFTLCVIRSLMGRVARFCSDELWCPLMGERHKASKGRALAGGCLPRASVEEVAGIG